MAVCRYWTASYFLPRKLIKEIERILKTFLRGGARKAKVSWSLLCLPKEKGGLSVYDLKAVNDAYLMKNLWNVCTNKEDLWVKWIHTVILKDKAMWETKAKATDSWLWRKTLGVRDKFKDCIGKNLCNGEETSFWHDPWHPWSILSLKHPELVRKLPINPKAKVSNVLNRGTWTLPFGRGWNSQVATFYQVCKSIPLIRGNDQWTWKPHKTFSVKNATLALQQPRANVDWYEIVWCKHFLPRCAIITWLACWKRMSTLDKLFLWGLAQSNICLLCHRLSEDQEHLFFLCPFLGKMWSYIMNSLSCVGWDCTWSHTLDWLKHTTSWKSKFQKDVTRLSFSIAVYHIWKERNNRLHNNIHRDHKVLMHDIMQSICYDVGTWKRYKMSQFNWELSLTLGLSSRIFSPTLTLIVGIFFVQIILTVLDVTSIWPLKSKSRTSCYT